MQAETVLAVFLVVCLAVFFSVNLHNIWKSRRVRSGVKAYAEVERPLSFVVSLAVLGTVVYFLEALLYPFLVFSGLIYVLPSFLFCFQFPFALCTQILGSILTLIGYFVFVWSVIARGRYAVSWEMPENQRLVTWGPYRYVRHPSYLGYFLMFFGLFFLWPTFFTLLPLTAVPGYYRTTFDEEELLVKRFGDKYLEYQKKTGRFVPRVSVLHKLLSSKV